MGIRFSEAEYRELVRRGIARGSEVAALPAKRKSRIPGDSRGRGMNKTEARFAQWLDARVRDGELVGWWYEPFSLRLAPRTHYRPDFLVQSADGLLGIYEVKGAFIRDRAMVKPKVAAAMYPCFRWYLAQWREGAWMVRELGG